MDNSSTKPKLKRKSRLLLIGLVNWELKKTLSAFSGKLHHQMAMYKTVTNEECRLPGYAFYCTVCGCDFSVAHGGKDDVRRHIDSAKHKDNTVAAQSKSISSFFSTPKT